VPELRNDLDRVVGGNICDVQNFMNLPPMVEKTSPLRCLLAGLLRVPLFQGSTVPPLLRPPPPPLPLHRTELFLFHLLHDVNDVNARVSAVEWGLPSGTVEHPLPAPREPRPRRRLASANNATEDFVVPNLSKEGEKHRPEE